MDNQVQENPANSLEVPKKKQSKVLLVLLVILFVLLAFAGGAAAGYFYNEWLSEREDESTEIDQISDENVQVTTTTTEVKSSNDSFWIYEEYVGAWEDVLEVSNRPAITLSGSFDCVWEHYDNYSECKLDDNGFVLVQEGDNYKVKEGEAVLWEREISSGPCNGVTGFKSFGDEFIVDYLMIDPELDSIVYSNDESLADVLDSEDYERAFAPFVVMGKLVYIAEENGKMFTVYDGIELGEKYDEIYYACCCEGVKYSVRGDGNIIDFFAKKDDGEWYHVRAGDKEEAENLS